MIIQKIKGFTLIEVLVILSIIAIMTIAVFSNYGKNNEIFVLERASQKLAQDLRRTQEMAMSGFGGDSSTYGYGMYFNKTTGASPANYLKYIIYEERDTDHLNILMYFEGEDTVEEIINIEKGIKICDISDNGTSLNTRSISFEPPNPLTIIGGVASGREASIVLCIANDISKTRTVKINNAGRVEITNP